MTQITDLMQSLASKCKFSVTVTINEHRDKNQTVEEYFNDLVSINAVDMEDIQEVMAEMITTNTVIDIHFYPTSSVGYYNVYHWDLAEGLKLALEALENGG